MPTEDVPNGDARKIVLIVGAAAVVLAIILIAVFMPREPEVDPYVVQLEAEVASYTAQIDSLNAVVDGMDSRLNTIRAEMDTARAANRKLLSSLRKVSGELQKYQRLYSPVTTSVADRLCRAVNERARSSATPTCPARTTASSISEGRKGRRSGAARSR